MKRSESFIVVAPGLSYLSSFVKLLRLLFTIVCNNLECLSLARFCSLQVRPEPNEVLAPIRVLHFKMTPGSVFTTLYVIHNSQIIPVS